MVGELDQFATLSENAKNLDIRYDTLRSRLRRAGKTGMLPKESLRRNFRVEVQEMKSIDAVEHLLQILEQDMPSLPEPLTDYSEFFISGKPRKVHIRFFALLHSMKGRVVSKEKIYEHLYWDYIDCGPDIKTLDGHLSHIRKDLVKDLVIETIPKYGLRLVDAG